MWKLVEWLSPSQIRPKSTMRESLGSPVLSGEIRNVGGNVYALLCVGGG